MERNTQSGLASKRIYTLYHEDLTSIERIRTHLTTEAQGVERASSSDAVRYAIRLTARMIQEIEREAAGVGDYVGPVTGCVRCSSTCPACDECGLQLSCPSCGPQCRTCECESTPDGPGQTIAETEATTVRSV